MRKLISTALIAAALLLTGYSSYSNPLDWSIEVRGKAKISGDSEQHLKIDCVGNEGVCYTISRKDGKWFITIQLQTTQSAEIPHGSTVNGIPVEALTPDNCPTGNLDIILPPC